MLLTLFVEMLIPKGAKPKEASQAEKPNKASGAEKSKEALSQKQKLISNLASIRSEDQGLKLVSGTLGPTPQPATGKQMFRT